MSSVLAIAVMSDGDNALGTVTELWVWDNQWYDDGQCDHGGSEHIDAQTLLQDSGGIFRLGDAHPGTGIERWVGQERNPFRVTETRQKSEKRKKEG